MIDQQVLIVKVAHIITLILFAGTGTSDPELWQAGTFQPNTGAAAWYAWPVDTYSTVIGAADQSVCQPWDTGYYSNAGSISCLTTVCGDGIVGKHLTSY